MGKSYRDLFIWRESVDVAADIVVMSEEFPRLKSFALVDQMQRSAISVPSNIAEGKGRLAQKELRQWSACAKSASASTTG
jgi:four helix bundle protein